MVQVGAGGTCAGLVGFGINSHGYRDLFFSAVASDTRKTPVRLVGFGRANTNVTCAE